jgi:hypothetical protein
MNKKTENSVWIQIILRGQQVNKIQGKNLSKEWKAFYQTRFLSH